MNLVLWLIFFTVLGACIGSFLNVVVYRLPAGRSIITPPSACPHCGYRLRWFDNVPVLAWFYLRGRCRQCKAPISFQYPLVEAITALLFGGWFYICYFTTIRPNIAGFGFESTWPICLVYMVMFAGLLAATLIDARHYIIPLGITWLIAAVALVVLPLTAGFLSKVRLLGSICGIRSDLTVGYLGTAFRPYPVIPTAFGPWIGAALGGAVGLIVANVLLWKKAIPRSFAELTAEQQQAEQDNPDDPAAFLAHPHPRREVLKEALFLAWPVAGAVVGWLVGQHGGCLSASAIQPPWLMALGGVMLGYLVGGGLIWATRLFGTLGFGKEAMGLGDVHLLAAVGAVIGWQAAVLTFFIAPFIGLIWTAVAQGVAAVLKRKVRVIPYGPHLAAATLVVCVFHQPLMNRLAILLGS